MQGVRLAMRSSSRQSRSSLAGTGYVGDPRRNALPCQQRPAQANWRCLRSRPKQRKNRAVQADPFSPFSQSYNQTGIALSPNAVRRADVTLTVGQVSETVTVEALAAALQTDRSDVRAEMTQQTLAKIAVPIGRLLQAVRDLGGAQ